MSSVRNLSASLLAAASLSQGSSVVDAAPFLSGTSVAPRSATCRSCLGDAWQVLPNEPGEDGTTNCPPSSLHECSSVDATTSILGVPRGGASKDSDKDNASTDDKAKKSKTRKKKVRRDETNADERTDENVNKLPKKKERKNTSQKSAKNPEPEKSTSSTTTNESSSSVPPMVEEVLQQDDYYKVLGLDKQQVAQSPQSAAATIKKAYRRRALLTHPDKTNGDRRAFDKVAEAYDVLSDESKRKVYDRFGKKGVEQQATGGMGAGGFHAGSFSNAEDMFRSFFGGAGMGASSSFSRGNSNPFTRRNRTLRYQLEVTLEDMYKGAIRNVLVSPPGFSSRYSHGSNKRVEVNIPRGALDGQTIVLSGEMDIDPNETPGDLVFELQQRQHSVFTRKGYDLAMSVRVRLRDAVSGVEQKVKHLNGKEILLQSARRKNGDGEDEPVMIKDDDVHVLNGYGMPKDAQGDSYGDLYVQFKVVMPNAKSSTLTKEEKVQLADLLDKLEGYRHRQYSHTDTSDSEQGAKGKKSNAMPMKKASLSDFGRASGQPQMPQHDEIHDDDGGHEDYHGFRSHFSSSNPFFGMHQQGMFHEQGMDENVQCQQM